MQILIVFLLFTTCKLSTPLGVYDRENGRLLRDLHHGKLFQTIGDWFGDLKNHINERLFGQTTTTTTTTTTLSPLPIEILNLDKFQLQKRLRNREWFLLDLTNLTFDPNHDWGFHVGSWYFIRKGFKDRYGSGNDFDESDFQSSQSTVQSQNPTEVNIEETFETTNDFVTTEFSSAISTTITQSEMPLVTTQNSMETYSSESSSSTYVSVEDDKITKDFTQKGSVEVLIG
ncbi:uncharacterized protein LOC114871079 [Osmia bicornis bicornis]|uniref:uncharacterized protein LOC114871079 n=1 Tax=Osmia bicornis bicornis TaxID=1437191 RepID=UPI001EAF4434|nr:uncharacterized protein LOC114871079 [Osmia bicornis bicornis]